MKQEVNSQDAWIFYCDKKFPRKIGFPEQFKIDNSDELVEHMAKNNGVKNCFVGIYSLDPKNDPRVDLLFLDFDVHKKKLDYKNKEDLQLLEECYEETDGVKNYLENKFGSKVIMAFSGRRGFHLYLFFDEIKLHKPKETLKFFCEQLTKELGLEYIDKALTKNLPSRMARMPFTVHKETGLYSYILPHNDMKLDEIIQMAENPEPKLIKRDISIDFGNMIIDLDLYVLKNKTKKISESRPIIPVSPIGGFLKLQCIQCLLKHKLKTGGRRMKASKFMAIAYFNDYGNMEGFDKIAEDFAERQSVDDELKAAEVKGWSQGIEQIEKTWNCGEIKKYLAENELNEEYTCKDCLFEGININFIVYEANDEKRILKIWKTKEKYRLQLWGNQPSFVFTLNYINELDTIKQKTCRAKLLENVPNNQRGVVIANILKKLQDIEWEPSQEMKNKKESKTPDDIDLAAIELLQDKSLLNRMNNSLEYELTGNDKTRLFQIVMCESRLYHTELVRAGGVNAAGKNMLLKPISKLYSDDVVFKYGSMSAPFLRRKVLEKELDTKNMIFIHLEDRQEGSTFDFEQMHGDETVKICLNIKDESGGWKPTEIDMEGPLVHFTTSTEEPDKHLLSRSWLTNPDESIEQTKRISLWRKWKKKLCDKDINKYKKQLEILKCALSKLKTYKRIIIPYLDFICFPLATPDDRRKEQCFLDLIEYIAHIYQYQRPRNEKAGILISLPQDFYYAIDLTEDILEITRGGLVEREKQALKLIETTDIACRNCFGKTSYFDKDGEVEYGGDWFLVTDCVNNKDWDWGIDVTRKTLNDLVKKSRLKKERAGKFNIYTRLDLKKRESETNGDSNDGQPNIRTHGLPTLSKPVTRVDIVDYARASLTDQSPMYIDIHTQIPENFEYTYPFRTGFTYVFNDYLCHQKEITKDEPHRVINNPTITLTSI